MTTLPPGDWPYIFQVYLFLNQQLTIAIWKGNCIAEAARNNEMEYWLLEGFPGSMEMDTELISKEWMNTAFVEGGKHVLDKPYIK